MSDTDLLFMPAVKAAALIRAKKLSPVDYVDTVLKAIERTQPRLNCFRVVMAEEARRNARKAEETVTRGDKLGPLHGVPVTTKINTEQRGHPTDNGVVAFKDLIAPDDAPDIGAREFPRRQCPHRHRHGLGAGVAAHAGHDRHQHRKRHHLLKRSLEHTDHE